MRELSVFEALTLSIFAFVFPFFLIAVWTQS